MQRYMIKTKDGYKDFLGIQKSNETHGLKITFDTCFIKCTKTHRILVNNKFIQAKNLKIGDIISDHKILNIEEIIDEFYDIVGVQGNTYSCNGFEHHNCSIIVVDETAFLKTDLWNDFIDSIAPTQSALAWKKNIFLSTANGANHFRTMCVDAQKHKKYLELDPETQVQLEDGTLITLEEFYGSQK